MHIPDGYLAAPVWVALDAVAAPSVALLARQSKRESDEWSAPLLGVMGAFVFAAQMINFPVGLGTSAHLIGSTLLSVCLGPAAASVVITAILAIQALVFQDGGLLALGANVFNMAIAGVLAGYAPYYLLSRARIPMAGAAAGAFVSVVVSGALAIAELLGSGVRIPPAALSVSAIAFAISAILEAAITVIVLRALGRLKSRAVGAAPSRPGIFAALGIASLALAGCAFFLASSAPDGIEKALANSETVRRAVAALPAVMPDYELPGMGPEWVRRGVAGLTGVALALGVSAAIAKILSRKRAGASGGA